MCVCKDGPCPTTACCPPDSRASIPSRANPWGPEPQPGRLQRRGRCCRRRRLWPVAPRHGHRRFGAPAGILVRAVRAQAQPRPHPHPPGLHGAGGRADDTACGDDAARMMAVLSRPDAADPMSLPLPGLGLDGARSRPARACGWGLWLDAGAGLPLDPAGGARPWWAAAQAFEAAGAHVEPLPGLGHAAPVSRASTASGARARRWTWPRCRRSDAN